MIVKDKNKYLHKTIWRQIPIFYIFLNMKNSYLLAVLIAMTTTTILKDEAARQIIKNCVTGGPPLVRSPIVRIPLVRFLVL